ncbi:hypothetical protein ABZ667_44165 [Streptomyces lavendulae]|uniref:bestrophin-like domain n=1 Tax=Streptomyces lavendulae TaxID=1914 RepID=UPI0033E525F7
MIDDEWGRLEKGTVSGRAWAELDATRSRTIAALTAVDDRSAKNLDAAIQIVYTERRVRLAAAKEGIAPVLIYALMATATVAVLFLPLMGWPHGVRPSIGLGLIAGLFAAGIWLVLQLNHPYGNGIHVSPDAFRDAIARYPSLAG